MIKTIVVLLLVSGSAMAMDCGLYYSYGTAKYAECQDRNQDRINGQNQANQARLDNWTNQTAAEDQTRKISNALEDQALIHPKAMKVPKLSEDANP